LKIKIILDYIIPEFLFGERAVGDLAIERQVVNFLVSAIIFVPDLLGITFIMLAARQEYRQGDYRRP